MPTYTVYLAARPVDALKNVMLPLHNMAKNNIHHRGLVGILSRSIEALETTALVTAAHVGLVINGRWFHLKKEQDNHLGLDLTPFDSSTELYHIPICKTTMTYEQCLGVALCILARMSGTSRPDRIPISYHGRHKKDVSFDRSKFNSSATRPTSGNGEYSLKNSCVKFAYEFIWQTLKGSAVRAHHNVHDFIIEALGVHHNDPHHKEDHKKHAHHHHHHPHHHRRHEHRKHHEVIRWRVGEFRSERHLLDHFLNIKIAQQ